MVRYHAVDQAVEEDQVGGVEVGEVEVGEVGEAVVIEEEVVVVEVVVVAGRFGNLQERMQ